MKIKVMKSDTGCCASDCEFHKDNWCNLFFIDLIGDINNPTRFNSCQMLTETDAEFTSPRFEIIGECFGCQNYRENHIYNCTAGILCVDGDLNRFKN